MTDKLKIVLDLVRKGAITDEQAQELLDTEKEYVYQQQPWYYHNWYNDWVYPLKYPLITYNYTAV